MNVAFGFTKSSLKRWTFFKSWDFFGVFRKLYYRFSKNQPNTILEKLKLFWRFTMFFFGYIAESNWRGNGKTFTFFWKKKTHRKTRKKYFQLFEFLVYFSPLFMSFF